MLISPILAKVLTSTLAFQGLDAQQALRLAGLSETHAQDDGPWLTVEQFDRLMCAATTVTGDPALGLGSGQHAALAMHGVIATVTIHMPTLEDGVRNVMRFSPLLLSEPELFFEQHGERASLTIQPAGCSEQGRRFRAETVMTGLMILLRMVCRGPQDTARIRSLQLDYPAPPYADRYAAHFGVPVTFNAPLCRLSFDTEMLSLPGPAYDVASYSAAYTRAELALSALRRDDTLAQRMQQLLMSTLPQTLTAADAAERLGMSERSLRRRLMAAGHSYTDLVRDSKRQLAERLLADLSRPIKVVAEAAGFESVSSFHRAFRTWHRLTPMQWRAQQAEAKPPLPVVDRVKAA